MRFNCEVATMPALSLVAINPYHLDPLSVYDRIGIIGFNYLESSRFSCPFAFFVSLSYVLIMVVIDVSCIVPAKCNDSFVSLSPHSLLILSSFLLLLSFFSPLSLLFPSSSFPPLPHHQHIFNLDADEVELLIRSKWDVMRCYMSSVLMLDVVYSSYLSHNHSHYPASSQSQENMSLLSVFCLCVSVFSIYLKLCMSPCLCLCLCLLYLFEIMSLLSLSLPPTP